MEIFYWTILKLINFFLIGDVIKTIIVILIIADAVLETAAAAILIAANVYCSGHSSLKAIGDFNYCNFYFILFNSFLRFKNWFLIELNLI